jgi:HAD superfamily hydrolase (TIGR01509 family)
MNLPDFLPRAVICDMDGLILDTERLDREIWREVMAENGLEYPEDLHASVVGLTGEQTIRRLSDVYGAAVPVAAYHSEVLARWTRRLEAAPAPIRPGALKLLDWLEAHRIPVAIATSTRRDNARMRLGPLVQRFDAIACGDEVAHRKPAPDLYQLALARLGFNATGCLALEDSEAGVRSAEAAGLSVVGVPDLVEPPLCSYRANSLYDVIVAFERLV